MRISCVTKICSIFYLVGTASALATPLIPIRQGMTWEYHMTQEVGEGIALSNATPDADGKIHLPVVYRISGIQDADGKDLLEFEMHRDGVVTNTDLITVDDRGIICWGRINLSGEVIDLDPPQTMVAAPLKTGANWNFDGLIAEMKVHQHYHVTGEEDVDVPAGNFRAFRIHGDQTLPIQMTIDRWFVPGIGIVKDVTATRSADGKLLQRISLELRERPKIMPRPEVKPTEPPKKLSAAMASEPAGQPETTFSADTSKIYARWQGNHLRNHAKVRVVWIAEKVEDVPPDYKIDEGFTFADGPNSRGHLTLSRPDGGWAPGDYRAEFYVDDVLQQTVKIEITQ